MATNRYDTQNAYCPFNGFNPPCGLCMWAIEDSDEHLMCAVALIAKGSTHCLNESLYFSVVRKVDDDD